MERVTEASGHRSDSWRLCIMGSSHRPIDRFVVPAHGARYNLSANRRRSEEIAMPLSPPWIS